MSFSEQLFSEDNLIKGKTRYEEMHPEMEGKELEPVDGKKVGDTLQKIADKKEDGKEKDQKSEIPSPKEMQDAIAVSKANLKVAAEVDPSNLALQEHGPEVIKQAGLEVEKKGWPC